MSAAVRLRSSGGGAKVVVLRACVGGGGGIFSNMMSGWLDVELRHPKKIYTPVPRQVWILRRKQRGCWQ